MGWDLPDTNKSFKQLLISGVSSEYEILEEYSDEIDPALIKVLGDYLKELKRSL